MVTQQNMLIYNGDQMTITPEIKQEIQKWIEALESGEYKQGKMHLNSFPDHYCCLGVACKVLVKGYLKDGEGLLSGAVPYFSNGAPQWLEDINRDFLSKTGRHLSTLNDAYSFTFEAIAELLKLVYLDEVSVDLRGSNTTL